MSDKPTTLTLTHRELWEALGISPSRFYELKKTGLFDHLESHIPFRYSRAKVEAWVNGTSRPWRVSA